MKGSKIEILIYIPIFPEILKNLEDFKQVYGAITSFHYINQLIIASYAFSVFRAVWYQLNEFDCFNASNLNFSLNS